MIASTFKLSAGASYIFSCVPKSKPKKGITIVSETKENKTVKMLKMIFPRRKANKVLRISEHGKILS